MRVNPTTKGFLAAGLVLLSSIQALGQDANEAVTLFGKMEAKVKAARNVEAKVLVLEEWRFKGSEPRRDETRIWLALGEENRSRLVLDKSIVGHKYRNELVSTGAAMRLSWPSGPSSPLYWLEQDTPKDWNSTLLNCLLRFEGGRGFGVHTVVDNRQSPSQKTVALLEEVGSPSGFALKGREKLGDRETVMLEYDIAYKERFGNGKHDTYHVTMWLDSSSLLPVRRLTRQVVGTLERTTTETFEAMTLDGTLPGGVFELPRIASARPGERPATNAELAGKIRSILERIDSDDPKIRDTASFELSRLGPAAIPQLELHLQSRNLEIRGQVAAAIDRIQRTHPLFLARAPLRRTTVRLNNSPVRAAFDEVFRPFPLRPSLGSHPSIPVPGQVTLSLDQASFWEAVLAFSRASKTTIVFHGFGGDLEFETDEGRDDGEAHSKPEGPVIAVAQAALKKDDLRLTVRLCLEPGWLPITGSLRLTSITKADGKEILSSFGEPPINERRRRNDREAEYDLCPSILVAELTTPSKNLQAGDRLALRGTATVTLPTRVDAAEFRVKDFKGDEQQALGELQIRVTRLEAREKSVRISDGCAGPQGWLPPPDKPYLAQVWVIVADDQGRSQYLGGRGYASGTTCSQGTPHKFPAPPTRLSYIRPMEAEVLEIPILIEGISVTQD
jgi:hypothetical protein